MYLRRYVGTVIHHTKREALTATVSVLHSRKKSRAKCSGYHNEDPNDSVQMSNKFFFDFAAAIV